MKLQNGSGSIVQLPDKANFTCYIFNNIHALGTKSDVRVSVQVNPNKGEIPPFARVNGGISPLFGLAPS